MSTTRTNIITNLKEEELHAVVKPVINQLTQSIVRTLIENFEKRIELLESENKDLQCKCK